MMVEAWLERAAAKRPAHVALEDAEGDTRCTYAELLHAARAGASWLAEQGVGSGQRVAIALPPGLAFAQALHACLLLGAVAVPVDLRLGPRERASVTAGAAFQVKEPLAVHGGLLAFESDVVVRGGTVAESGMSALPRTRPRALLPLGARHDLRATAAVIHTSGSTSAPKPVELTYGNFLWSALGSAVALGLEPPARGRGERWLCALPVAHVGGLSILMRSAIYTSTAIVHERFDVERVRCALVERNVTLVSLVASTLVRLLDGGLARPPALRCALTGGGPVPAALLERAYAAGVPVRQTYGLTESCSQVTTATRSGGSGGDSDAGPSLTGTPLLDAGPPLFCTRVRIAPDGEILVGGPTVAPACVASDGWLHTGDLGEVGEHGGLRVTGRKADTIVSGGENVAPTEVEAVLEAHPDVLEAAVLGRADAHWGEAVTAVVVLRPGAQVGGQALREHCAAHLAPYKVPKQVLFATAPLPRTRSGKLLRRELAHGL
jgi:o-succinylbenzoate---CoA ligase